MSKSVLAVVSVLGKDQKGVVASVATYLAERGINIEDIEQHVVRGFFLMDMLVDLKELSVPLTELSTGLLDLGRKLEMEVKLALHGERKSRKVALLCSKEPHCLQQLLGDFKAGLLHGEIVGVLSNHPELEGMARKAGVPFEFVRAEKDSPEHFEWLGKRLGELKPDLVVLARYMRILPEGLVRAFPSRIINIHPSLLPFFPGAAPYKQAFDSGVRVHGCTAHFITEQLDQGPVILQDVFHINVGVDTLEDVKLKGLELGAKVLSRAVQLYLDEELVVLEGKVIFKPGGFAVSAIRARRGEMVGEYDHPTETEWNSERREDGRAGGAGTQPARVASDPVNGTGQSLAPCSRSLARKSSRNGVKVSMRVAPAGVVRAPWGTLEGMATASPALRRVSLPSMVKTSSPAAT